MKRFGYCLIAVAMVLLLVCCSSPKASVDQLAESLSYDPDSQISFTVPDGEGEWNIAISGRVEAEGLGGMSVHYLEGTDWQPGGVYSFDVSGGGYTELYLDAQVNGEQVSLDLMDLLPDDLKAAE